MSDIVERLRGMADQRHMVRGNDAVDDALREASTEISTLRSRVEELEGALKIFADLGDYILAEAPIDATMFEVWTRGDIKQVSLEYFRRARAAIRALSSERKPT